MSLFPNFNAAHASAQKSAQKMAAEDMRFAFCDFIQMCIRYAYNKN
jgi:hypothetical protein